MIFLFIIPVLCSMKHFKDTYMPYVYRTNKELVEAITAQLRSRPNPQDRVGVFFERLARQYELMEGKCLILNSFREEAQMLDVDPLFLIEAQREKIIHWNEEKHVLKIALRAATFTPEELAEMTGFDGMTKEEVETIISKHADWFEFNPVRKRKIITLKSESKKALLNFIYNAA